MSRKHHTWSRTSNLLTIPSKYGVKISGVQFSLKFRIAEAACAYEYDRRQLIVRMPNLSGNLLSQVTNEKKINTEKSSNEYNNTKLGLMNTIISFVDEFCKPLNPFKYSVAPFPLNCNSILKCLTFLNSSTISCQCDETKQRNWIQLSSQGLDIHTPIISFLIYVLEFW